MRLCALQVNVLTTISFALLPQMDQKAQLCVQTAHSQIQSKTVFKTSANQSTSIAQKENASRRKRTAELEFLAQTSTLTSVPTVHAKRTPPCAK